MRVWCPPWCCSLTVVVEMEGVQAAVEWTLFLKMSQATSDEEKGERSETTVLTPYDLARLQLSL